MFGLEGFKRILRALQELSRQFSESPSKRHIWQAPILHAARRYLHIHMQICTYLSTHKHMHVYVCIYLYIYMYTDVYNAYIYIHAHKLTHTCTYMCIYKHINTHVLIQCLNDRWEAHCKVPSWRNLARISTASPRFDVKNAVWSSGICADLSYIKSMRP